MSEQAESYDKEYGRMLHHSREVLPILYLYDKIHLEEAVSENHQASAESKKKLKERLLALQGTVAEFPENAQRVIIKTKIHEEVLDIAKIAGEQEVKRFYSDLLKSYSTTPEKLDRQEVAGAFLKQKDLNIYQLRMCLAVAPDYVGQVLEQFPEVKERVVKLMENPKNFLILQSLKDNDALKNNFDMPQMIEQTKEKLQNLSGKEVYDVFTALESDIPEAREAELQSGILKMYFEQTDLLGKHLHHVDVCYTRMHNEKHWERISEYLQAVGNFKCEPDAAAEVEERLGRILSLYTHQEAYTGKKVQFSYFLNDGMKQFAENMVAEVSKNPDSHLSQFYLKHSKRVLDQYECWDFYEDAAKVLLPKMVESGRFDVCKKICTDMATADGINHLVQRDFWSIAVDEWKNRPDSALSKYLAENAAEFPSAADGIIWKANGEIVCGKKYGRDTSPEMQEMLCQKIYEVFQKTGVENVHLVHNNLVELCRETKNPQIAKVLQSIIPNVDFEKESIENCYILWQTTGLKEYEDILDGKIASVETLQIGFSEEDKNMVADWKPLFEKLQKSNIKELEVRYLPEEAASYAFKGYKALEKLRTTNDLSAQDVVPNPNLKELRCWKFENPVEAVKQLPNLVDFYVKAELGEPAKLALGEYLLGEKPEKLETLEFKLVNAVAAELMRKYPTFICDYEGGARDADEAYKLRERNNIVRSVRDGDIDLTGKNNTYDIIRNHGLVECLQILPAEKRPKLAEIEKMNEKLYDKIKESYGSEKYAEIIGQVADALGEEHLKSYAMLFSACEKGEAVEYIKSLPQEKRPKISMLLEYQNAFEDDFEITICKKANEEEAGKIIVDMIKEMAPTDAELKDFAANEDCSKRMKRATSLILKEREVEAKTADMQAAFAKWQADNNKGRK